MTGESDRSPSHRRSRPRAENLSGPRLIPPLSTNCGRDCVVSLGTSSVSGSALEPPGPPPPGPSIESTTTSGWFLMEYDCVDPNAWNQGPRPGSPHANRPIATVRSEEHTSELQSLAYLV